jgi:hypothetical protein
MANTLDPIVCAPLLRKVDEQLIDLLSALAPHEWDLQTVAPLWKVRDVAAHLLDTALRKLSLVRDACHEHPLAARSNRIGQSVKSRGRRSVPAFQSADPDCHDEIGNKTICRIS